ncbi:DUF1491 family protein [Novosphingobium bradum]|uniref:DUF1491 family protein n=1 Tax=Novosphingobium bradum TaxID=1737444 RepID=A0ABV7IR00_9SPHN
MAEPEARLPSHVEAGALLRRVQQEGGFATVLARGEADAGTILVVLADRGAPPRAFERMPQLDGTRAWTLSRTGSAGDPQAFAEWLDRRRAQDPDLWIIELDIPQGERFIP